MAYIKTAIPVRRRIMVRGQVSEPVTATLALIGSAIKLGNWILDQFGVWGQWHWTDKRDEILKEVNALGLGDYVSSADMTNYAYGPIIRTTENKKYKEQTLDRDPKYTYVGQSTKTQWFKVVTTWNYFSNFYLQRLIKNRVIAKAKTICQGRGDTWTGTGCVPKANGGTGGPGFTTAGMIGKGIAFMIVGTVVYLGYRVFTKDKEEEA